MKPLNQAPLRSFHPVFAMWLGFGLALSYSVSGIAQEARITAAGPGAARTEAPLPSPLKLHFDEPITFPLGTKQTLIFSDFKCATDGSIFVPTAGEASNLDSNGVGPSVTVIALKPSGEVVRFIPQDIPGYRKVVALLPYFVSASHVYVLEMAEKTDPSDSQKAVGHPHLIQTFDQKGGLTQSIVLPPDIDPANLAAFESGEILVFASDKLNKTSHLILFDATGRRESELSLFDSDFGSQLKQAAGSQDRFYSSNDGEALPRLLELANLVPQGDDLLLSASQVNLPVLELNQRGLVRTTTLALPPGTTFQSLLPSDDGLLHAVLGDFRLIPYSTSAPPPSSPAPASEPSGGDRQVFSPTEIDEFLPHDGSLVRRVSLPRGPLPVCAINGRYTFLAPREEDGRLQLIRATPAQ